MALSFENGESPFDFDHRYHGSYCTEEHRALRATDEDMKSGNH